MNVSFQAQRDPLGDWYQCFCGRGVLVKKNEFKCNILKEISSINFLKKAGNPKLYLLRTSVQIASSSFNGTYLADT